MKTRLTPDERASRLDRRLAARTAAADQVEKIRAWRQERIAAAEKRAVERRKAQLAQPRGVDRVPERLRGLTFAVEPHLFGKRDVDHARPLAQSADLHPYGNHAARRAQGFRTRPRKTRRRELPGAETRRLERRRKAWLS